MEFSLGENRDKLNQFKLHNSRTNYSIDMKPFKPLSKLDKRDTTLISRKFEDELVVVFSILGKFGAFYKTESRRMVRDLNISLNNYLLPKES